jgi:hypothetical protein
MHINEPGFAEMAVRELGAMLPEASLKEMR